MGYGALTRARSGLFILVILLATQTLALAAMAREELASLVRPPLKLGERQSDLPAWRLIDAGGAPAGYLFETHDLAPIPGFAGTPINLLVAIDNAGDFLWVSVIEQNEPVFVSGLGPAPLHAFVTQYRGLSLAHNIAVGSPYAKPPESTSTNVYIDGVTKATASVRIANESILSAALQVARAYLSGVAPRPAARPRQDLFTAMSWDALLEAGLVVALRSEPSTIDQAFAGTDFVDGTTVNLADPEAQEHTLWVADLGVPTVARNLLDERSLAELKAQFATHEEPLLVMGRGRYSMLGETFVRNAVPDLLRLQQGGYPVNIRDADITVLLREDVPIPDEALILRVDTRLGFDPGSPWELGMRVIRQNGYFMPDIGTRDITVGYQLPEQLLQAPEATESGPSWLLAWRERTLEIGLLLGFIALLTVALVRMTWVTATRGRLDLIRHWALLFTLLFIGWYGQGQLSIVNLTGLVSTLRDGGSFAYLLYDPFTLLLWLFVLATAAFWGRGPFCGWLCPFGALQEFVGKLGQRFGIRQRRLPDRLDRSLLRVKYLLLYAILLAAAFSQALTDHLVEVEPFKTAITLGFDRAWPHVLYALALLGLTVVVYKGFCRYLCPLGAGLALLGRIRLLDWIPRRPECGAPCRACTNACEYRAIDHAGKIDYDECFQCLDCVALYQDVTRCLPLVRLERAPRDANQESNTVDAGSRQPPSSVDHQPA
jgi:transcriptional regulator of nitric oxide reductase/ferredoxin